MKKLYYQFMYELTDFVMWVNPKESQEHFLRWWEASEYYRRKRDQA